MRESVVGSTTVRIAGLDAKEISLGSIRFELEGIVSDGVSAATAAVEQWRGGHAETFVAEMNPFLRRLARLVQKVGQGQRAVAAWPESAGRDPLEEQAVGSAGVEVPASAGTSAANPATLDVLATWCLSVSERLPSMTAGVGLDDVTAEVTRQPLVFDFPVPNERWPDERSPASVLVEPEPVLVTVSSDPARYIDVPEVSGRVATITGTADHLGAFTAAVALAFRREDERLLALIMDHPGLADELLSGWADGEIGAESSLVILLAYFDVFDRARNGDEDGVISMEDLLEIGGSTDVPPYVREAANHLARNPELFTLVETVNDSTQPPALDEAGHYGGDGRMSRDDVELFLEFNDHLTVLDENFAAFDSAAHPDHGPDGVIDLDDLNALAEGDGTVALTAAWLLAHKPLYDRVARHHAGGGTGTEITTDSLVVLSVDQQVHADSAPDAAAFVDRRLDTLLSEPVGDAATAEGMYALFDTALTESDHRGELMGRVIDKVAEQGTIHNPGLPLAFANGTAANMALIDDNVNAAFPTADAPASEDAEQRYLNTHDFLRETSRDPQAADRLRQAVDDHGLTETANAGNVTDNDDRSNRLEALGRLQTFVTVAQDNALTGPALDDLRNQGPGPSAGSMTNYVLGYVPVLGEFNEVADGMGISAGANLDWLMNQLGVTGEEEFNSLDDAQRVDRVRKVEDVVDSAVWLALDRFGASGAADDEVLRVAVAGEPFVDGNGDLKSDPSESEVQAFRDWALRQTFEGGLTEADGDAFEAGAGAVLRGAQAPALEDRR